MSSRPERSVDEIRTEDSSGGQKGAKPSTLGLLPPEARDELARVYGMGANKYTETNYLKGYGWNKSIDAMYRHISEWEQGKDYDEESGLHHLAHAAWHCFTLMTFQWNDLGFDTRVQPHLDAGTMSEVHEYYESLKENDEPEEEEDQVITLTNPDPIKFTFPNVKIDEPWINQLQSDPMPITWSMKFTPDRPEDTVMTDAFAKLSSDIESDIAKEDADWIEHAWVDCECDFGPSHWICDVCGIIWYKTVDDEPQQGECFDAE